MQVRMPPDGPWQACEAGQSDEAHAQLTVPPQPAGMGMQA